MVKVNSPLSRSIDGIFRDFFSEFPTTVSKTVREDVLYYPPVNIVEYENHYLLELSAPGFEKTDFIISMDSKILTVKAEQKEENMTGKVIRREFGNKGFRRSFTVDEKIDTDKIDACYQNGILFVTLPKKTEQMKITKSIEVK
jgi:HSP20 family protein